MCCSDTTRTRPHVIHPAPKNFSHRREPQPDEGFDLSSLNLVHAEPRKLSSMAGSSSRDEEEAEYGVLLYYKFTSIPDLDNLFTFFDSNCRSLSLLGRVRLSPNGVNVTVIPPIKTP